MSNRSHPRTTGLVIVASVAAIITVAGTATPASAGDDGGAGASSTTTTAPGPSSSPAVASVASLRTDSATVRSELAAAQKARDEQFDKWALNHLANEAAHEELNRTAMVAEAARRDVLVAEGRVRRYAAEAFMNPPAGQTLAVLSMSDAREMSRAHDVLSILTEDQYRVVGELTAAKTDAERRSAEAERAVAAANESAAKAKSELERLDRAVQRQQQLAADVDARLDSALAEAAALQRVDSAAAADLADRERGLAAESSAAVAGDTAGRRGASSSTPTSPSRGSTTTTGPSPGSPSVTPPPGPPGGIVTWQDVTKVGGIWVNKSIASQVQSLLTAASSAGLSLSGGGYRDPASQIALREAHCGPTQYDIYEKPASQCTPPTATPGKSMHERGLAIDFQSSGVLITSQSDPAFIWLAGHAGTYGLYNLPSEPWHWSTNGT